MLDAGLMKGLSRTFRDPFRFAYDAHKGYWAHHNSLSPECALMDTVMKRAIFAVVFCLAAAGTAAAADDTLAGLIQAGQSRRRAQEDRRGRRCERSPGRRYNAAALGRLQDRRGSCPRAARARGEARCHQQLRLEPFGGGGKGWQCSPGQNAARCRQQRGGAEPRGPDGLDAGRARRDPWTLPNCWCATAPMSMHEKNGAARRR